AGKPRLVVGERHLPDTRRRCREFKKAPLLTRRRPRHQAPRTGGTPGVFVALVGAPRLDPPPQKNNAPWLRRCSLDPGEPAAPHRGSRKGRPHMFDHIISGATSPRGAVPDTSPDTVTQAGLRYLAAGLGLVPIAADGGCRPDFRLLPEVQDPQAGRRRRSWQGFRGTLADIEAWQRYAPYGLAVACGAASGGLEALHFRAYST